MNDPACSATLRDARLPLACGLDDAFAPAAARAPGNGFAEADALALGRAPGREQRVLDDESPVRVAIAFASKYGFDAGALPVRRRRKSVPAEAT